MQPAARACARRPWRRRSAGLTEERAIRDGGVDAWQVLEDRAARADVEVAHLAVAHLPLGQPDGRTGCVEQASAATSARSCRHARHRRRRDGIHRRDRGRRRSHRRPRSTTGRGRPPATEAPMRVLTRRSSARRRACAVTAARATMPAISSTLRLAPPTSAPSMAGSARNSPAEALVTLPPYSTGSAGAPIGRTERRGGRPDGVSHGRRVGAPRGPAGPDRPDRLIGDDQVRGTGAAASTTDERALQLGLDGRLRAARPPAPRAARRRTGSGAGPPSTQRTSLRPMSSSVSPWSRRRSECPTMAHVARPASMAAETPPVYAPAASACTSWAPTSTPVPASASRDGRQGTNGGQSTRDDRPGRRSPRRSPRPGGRPRAGRPFIFQLPATMTGRIAGIIPGAGPRAGAVGSAPGRSILGEGTMRSSARWTRDRSSGCAASSAERTPPGRRAGPPPTSRSCADSSCQPSVVQELAIAIELTMGRAHRPATGWHSSAFRTRLRWPWSCRVTSRDSSSRTLADAPIQRSSVSTPSVLFHGHHAAPPADPPRGREPHARPARQPAPVPPSGESRRAPGARRPPPRLSDPAARNRPREATPSRQWSARRAQSKGPARGASSSRTARRATTGERARPSAAAPRPARVADRQHDSTGSMAASSARSAATRSPPAAISGRGRAGLDVPRGSRSGSCHDLRGRRVGQALRGPPPQGLRLALVEYAA